MALPQATHARRKLTTDRGGSCCEGQALALLPRSGPCILCLMQKLLLFIVIPCALFSAELKLGKRLTRKPSVSLSDLAANPDRYVGKTFHVQGKVTEVCQAMGCWVMLTDGNGAMMRVQMPEGKVSFPKDAAGRSVTAEGTLAKYELSKEQAVAAAKHEAEESGKPFHPESVQGPRTVYQIEGTGAVLSE